MNNQAIEWLRDLAQLDIDAVSAYGQALEKIDDEEIFDNITRFKNDHVKHVEDLSQLIKQLGGEPPEFSKDLKGYLIEGITYLRSATGTIGALKAMKSNEVITNRNYKKALEKGVSLSEEIKSLLEKNYNDEKRHLEYIERTLNRLEEN